MGSFQKNIYIVCFSVRDILKKKDKIGKSDIEQCSKLFSSSKYQQWEESNVKICSITPKSSDVNSCRKQYNDSVKV